MKDDVIAIVVTYNIKMSELKKNIDTYINFVDKIIIIDNSDQTNDLSKMQNMKKIVYISLKENCGIAKALNVGIKYAIDNHYKYALTMDQDSTFNNNLIEIYEKYIQKDIIIYSPKYIIERKKEKKYKDKIKELYWTMTSGNIINLDLCKNVGEFKEDFFIDGVDYEYCLRARKKGYRIIQCNDAELKHNPGITKTKKILFWNYKYGYMSPTRMYYQVRNLSVISKEYHSLRANIIILIKLLKIILLFDNKKEFLYMFKKAKVDFKIKKMGKL